MKRNIIKMIAGLLAFVLLLSGLPAQIAHASAGEELLEVISYADGSYLEIRWRPCRRPERLAP